jgi:hypothetical protein
LKNSDLTCADEIHVSLMLDYPEVSHWMVGLKKLIYELKNISEANIAKTANSNDVELPSELNT